jgi:co-chaperonin GroES (HSP10)
MSAGGIVIPEKVQKTPLFKGKVLAVGPGYWTHDGPESTGSRVPMCCVVGDIVWFRPQDFYYVNQIDLGQALLPDTSVMAIERGE